MELSLWPGLAEKPNPYYSMDNYRLHKQAYEEERHACELDDQDIDMTWVTYPDYDGLPWAPIDAKFIQSHDVL